MTEEERDKLRVAAAALLHVMSLVTLDESVPDEIFVEMSAMSALMVRTLHELGVLDEGPWSVSEFDRVAARFEIERIADAINAQMEEA